MRELSLLQLGIHPEYIPDSPDVEAVDAVSHAVEISVAGEETFSGRPVVCGALAGRDRRATVDAVADTSRESEIVTGRTRASTGSMACEMGTFFHETPPSGSVVVIPCTRSQGEPYSRNEDAGGVATAVPYTQHAGVSVPFARISASTMASTTDLSVGENASRIEGVVDAATGGDIRKPYAQASRELGRLEDCITPDEMLEVVKTGMTHLAEEAAQTSVCDRRKGLSLPRIVLFVVGDGETLSRPAAFAVPPEYVSRLHSGRFDHYFTQTSFFNVLLLARDRTRPWMPMRCCHSSCTSWCKRTCHECTNLLTSFETSAGRLGGGKGHTTLLPCEMGVSQKAGDTLT